MYPNSYNLAYNDSSYSPDLREGLECVSKHQLHSTVMMTYLQTAEKQAEQLHHVSVAAVFDLLCQRLQAFTELLHLQRLAVFRHQPDDDARTHTHTPMAISLPEAVALQGKHSELHTTYLSANEAISWASEVRAATCWLEKEGRTQR